MLQELIDDVLDIVQDASFAASGQYSQGTISLTGLPTLAQPFVVDSRTFTFVTTRATAGQVTLGGTVDACVANIATAINTDLTSVTAAANTVTDTVLVTAAGQGAAWDSLVFTEACTNMTMDGGGVLGGTAAGVYGNRVKTFINDGLKFVSGSQRPLILLPALETTGTVTTSTTLNYVALPADYQKNLFRCYSSTYTRQVKVYDSEALLLRNFLQVDLAGRVLGVAVKGTNFVYQRIPSAAETLLIHYYARPTALSALTDRPTCLPDEGFTRELLVNYAIRECFKRIDQPEKAKEYDGYFKEAMVDLTMFLGPEAKVPVEFGDDLNLDYMMDDCCD